MKILAIDPGYDKVGYSIFVYSKGSTPVLIVSGLIKTSPKETIQNRISEACSEISELIKLHDIDHCVMEQLFFFKNAKTVIAVAQAQGALMQTCNFHHVPQTFLTPLEIKQAVTGDGRADKTSVWKMLKLQLGSDLKVKDDDESDAIACGLAFCSINKFGFM
ncbi:MAG: crossover junction endodeoxyribonuclease RuvC [Patescibacteria group bacterium]